MSWWDEELGGVQTYFVNYISRYGGECPTESHYIFTLFPDKLSNK